MSEEVTDHNFSKFIISYVSLSVIAGLFTFRLLNSFLDNIILPLLDISILPDKKFHKLTKIYDHKKTEVKEVIKKEDIIVIVFSYPHRYEKYNQYTPEELFQKYEQLLFGYKKFYFNGFYPFIEDIDFKFPKHYINPLGTLSYQLQVEEMVNKKSVWEYGSKMVWNDEDNYYEGDYHPNLEGYKIIGEYIYKEIKDLI